MKLSVLGSTGSIGRQSLEVIEKLGHQVIALTAGTNVDLLEQQARKFKPRLAVMSDESAAAELKIRLADTGIEVLGGDEAVCDAARLYDADCVIGAVLGMAALKPVLSAVEAGKRIGLANKESLVCAGELIMESARKNNAQIIPVDSEHSAIFQCLQGNTDRGEVKRLILTCSGGPFFGRSKTDIEKVTAADALKHPNWNMGAKITIDSATLMNKGLEFIEAMRLYAVEPEKVSVVIHRQSIIHSLVEYRDNAMLAQLGAPDMRVPIQYAITYPNRFVCPAPEVDLLKCGDMTFAAPDLEAFPCLAIAMETAPKGQLACTVMNAANEVAVAAFLKGETGFYGISDGIAHTLSKVDAAGEATLENIFAADSEARQVAREYFGRT
ncbi:MAG: 1-deoxy-D-xylulose-5-phosphate reductoisomerase [Oscillospiraceae bacterium]|nr:1-deoxy-D-xylulose-5-phosphate reductoisomerase [Oscillospiraceae bacterium]